jgi:hypothetical protein
MSISKDLFLAIASMDAYNWGYDVGLEISATGSGWRHSTVSQTIAIFLSHIRPEFK